MIFREVRIFVLYVWGSLYAQNMALNLAAMSGHAEMVSYLLSVPEQELFLNAHKQTVMDMAISAGKEDVAMAIIEHDRYTGYCSISFLHFISILAILARKASPRSFVL